MEGSLGKHPSQTSLHDHSQTQGPGQGPDPNVPTNQMLEMNDDGLDHQEMDGYKVGIDDQEDHQSIGSAVTVNSLGVSLEDSLVNKLMMRNNNNNNPVSNPASNHNSLVFNDSGRVSKHSTGTNNLPTTIVISDSSNSVAFNGSAKASKKSVGSNNNSINPASITNASNNSNNNSSNPNNNSNNINLDNNVRAFEAMLADLQVFPSGNHPHPPPLYSSSSCSSSSSFTYLPAPHHHLFHQLPP